MGVLHTKLIIDQLYCFKQDRQKSMGKKDREREKDREGGKREREREGKRER